MKTLKLFLLVPVAAVALAACVHPTPVPQSPSPSVSTSTVAPTVSPSPLPAPTPSVSPSWTWPPTSACGYERWPVKTGTDTDAGKINLSSVIDTTIDGLSLLAAPSSLPQNDRLSPFETTVYRIHGTIIAYKMEPDSDYHLVVRGVSGLTMIVEIPDPACVADRTGPLLAGIELARTQFDARFQPNGSF